LAEEQSLKFSIKVENKIAASQWRAARGGGGKWGHAPWSAGLGSAAVQLFAVL